MSKKSPQKSTQKNVKIWAKNDPKNAKKWPIFSIFSILRGKCRNFLKYFEKMSIFKAKMQDFGGPDPEKVWPGGFSRVY